MVPSRWRRGSRWHNGWFGCVKGRVPEARVLPTWKSSHKNRNKKNPKKTEHKTKTHQNKKTNRNHHNIFLPSRFFFFFFFRFLPAAALQRCNRQRLEEFLMGCLRLRGSARAMDMAKLCHDQVISVGRFGSFCSAFSIFFLNWLFSVISGPLFLFLGRFLQGFLYGLLRIFGCFLQVFFLMG